MPNNTQIPAQCYTQTLTIAAQPTYSATVVTLLNKVDKHSCTGGQKYSNKKKACACFSHSAWNGTQCVCNADYKMTTKASKTKKIKSLFCAKINSNSTASTLLSYSTICSTATIVGLSSIASASSSSVDPSYTLSSIPSSTVPVNSSTSLLIDANPQTSSSLTSPKSSTGLTDLSASSGVINASVNVNDSARIQNVSSLNIPMDVVNKSNTSDSANAYASSSGFFSFDDY